MFFKREEEPYFTDEDLEYLGRIAKFLPKETMKTIEEARLAQHVSFQEAKIPMTLMGTKIIPQLISEVEAVSTFVNDCNKNIKKQIQNILFQRFAEQAHENIPDLIAPHIEGYDDVKGALALQLFAKDPVHILLLGDQKEFTRSAAELAPHSKIGLDIENNQPGLIGSYHHAQFQPGTLVQAHNGLCVLESLENIQDDCKPLLCHAMDHGFVTPVIEGNSYRYDSVISVAATAQLKEQTDSRRMWDFKKVLPFESSLISRFHIIFLLNKPIKLHFENTLKENVLTPADKQFLEQYINLARKGKVRFPKEHEQDVIEYVRGLKKEERRLIAEVSPRTVVGIMNLAKASARMNLRNRVEKNDIERVKLIFNRAIDTGLV